MVVCASNTAQGRQKGGSGDPEAILGYIVTSISQKTEILFS